MQLLGMTVGLAAVLALYPDAGTTADDVVVPHTHEDAAPAPVHH